MTSASSPSVFVVSFWKPITLLVATSLLLLIAICTGVGVYGRPSIDFGTGVVVSSPRFRSDYLRHRKLLAPADSCSYLSADVDESHSLGGEDKKQVVVYKPSRAWGDDRCSESDIVIDQGPSSPLPDGIPTYSVEILNACSSGCDIAGIHVRCGKFSTARLIDPEIFTRISIDDCLVYGGKPLPNGMTLSFQYANTYPYPMDVFKYQCCPPPP
uniref:Uncharacterized protein n=1 Tax=Kalanchoe fedtschenkoi TaxID=63787 RepID=A0A7N0VKM9_KALFE